MALCNFRVVGSNPAPNTIYFFLFFSSFFVIFSILRWFLVKSNPLHLHSPLFMILIIPNIVQNLCLHLLMLFILGLHPPYPPHHPPTSNLATPTSPTPNRTPPPTPTHPPLKIFFFEFSQKLYFSVHIRLDPPTRHPPPPPPPPPQFFFFFFFSQKFQFSVPITLPPPPTRPPPPPP